MSDKPFKEKDGFEKVVAVAIIGIVVGAFTILGFFGNHNCDSDEAFLYCRLHPASVVQKIGIFGFYLTAFILSGLWKKWLTLWNEENSTRWNFIFFLVGVASFLMLWFG